jgi:hypothetical protein
MKANSRSKYRTHDLKLQVAMRAMKTRDCKRNKKQREAGGVGTEDQCGRTNTKKQTKTRTPTPLMMWTRMAAINNKNPERKKNRQDEQNNRGMGHRERVKAYELTEVDSHVVQEKRARKGNTTDYSQLIADEGEE